jgi:hypothetical protein
LYFDDHSPITGFQSIRALRNCINLVIPAIGGCPSRLPFIYIIFDDPWVAVGLTSAENAKAGCLFGALEDYRTIRVDHGKRDLGNAIPIAGRPVRVSKTLTRKR